MTDRLPVRPLAVLLLIALLGTPPLAPAQAPERPVTAIIGAFGEEIRLILEQISNPQPEVHLGVRFVVGQLRGRSVVVAQIGVGKVNAAMTTTLLVDQCRPEQVIFTGIAGALGPQLRPGDVVIGEKLVQHDLGTLTAAGMERQGVRNPVDGAENPVFFASDSVLARLALELGQQTDLLPVPTQHGERQPSVGLGTIVTGDVFVASAESKQALRGELEADAVEMEGAAVAQVCYQQRVAFVVIRSMSDSADETAQQDLKRFYRVAAENSARLVVDLVAELATAPQPASPAPR